MTVPFLTPIAPTGWLELDGSNISRTTYSDLWTAVTIQQSGTRSSGSAVITGLSSTTHMKVGYYVGGSGFAVGTTIVSIDSSSQITVSNNASSSGSATVIVSPWQQGDGSSTFTLPDMMTDGRFARSRTSSIAVGTSQTDQNKSHTHIADSVSDHTHTVDIPSGQGSHSHSSSPGSVCVAGSSAVASGSTFAFQFGSILAAVLPALTGTTNSAGGYTPTIQTEGGSESRPKSLVFLWCVKF